MSAKKSCSNQEITNYIKSPIPEVLAQKTIGELLQDNCDNEIVIRNQSVAMRKMSEDGILTINYTARSNGGYEITQTENSIQSEKKDNLPFIEEMLKGGKSQKDIAYELGMSPSYVSKLLKSKKDK